MTYLRHVSVPVNFSIWNQIINGVKRADWKLILKNRTSKNSILQGTYAMIRVTRIASANIKKKANSSFGSRRYFLPEIADFRGGFTDLTAMASPVVEPPSVLQRPTIPLTYTGRSNPPFFRWAAKWALYLNRNIWALILGTAQLDYVKNNGLNYKFDLILSLDLRDFNLYTLKLI